MERWLDDEDNNRSITNLHMLAEKFRNDEPNHPSFAFQVEIAMKLVSNGFTVQAVECEDASKCKDVDIVLNVTGAAKSGRMDADAVQAKGVNIQAWYGKFRPDYEKGWEPHRSGPKMFFYEWDEISRNTVEKKFRQLPERGLGLVINRMPDGDSRFRDPPVAGFCTINKCLIMSNSKDEAPIYGLREFERHMPLVARICKALGWEPVDKLGVENMRDLVVIEEGLVLDDGVDTVSVTEEDQAKE